MSPSVQATLPPYSSVSKQNHDFNGPTSTTVKHLHIKPRNHSSQMSIHIENPAAQPDTHQIPISPTSSQPTSISIQEPLLSFHQIATSDTELTGKIVYGGAHKKEAVTVDLG